MSALKASGNVIDKCSLMVLWIDVDKSIPVGMEIDKCTIVVGS